MNFKPRKIENKHRGFAYVAILCLVIILGTAGLAFLHTVGTELKAGSLRGSCMQAHYLAEAAAHHAMWRLLYEPGFPGSEDVYYMHSMAGGRYGYKVRKNTETTFATVATLGAVGTHTVHQSYVLHIIPFMITGSYTGNNWDNRAITGLGFRPDVVIIKGDTGKVAVIRTSTMSADSSKEMVGNNELLGNRIQSIEDEGFVVGNDKSVNEFGVKYFWAAFKAKQGLMKIGTYTGDGTVNRILSGIGFDPQLIMVIPEDKYEMVHRSPLAVDSYNFDSSNGIADCLTTPMPSDGFRIGSNDRVNRSGKTYHYICWAEVPGYTKFETYTGNDWDNRNITGLGFKPEYVMVRAVSEGHDQIHYP
ncbi:MAG: hypothetical protein ABIK28_06945, partial [Planctomycetota bacterium]